MEISEEGVTVQCIGGRILLKRVKPSEGSKQPAAEWAAAIGLNVKDKVGI